MKWLILTGPHKTPRIRLLENAFKVAGVNAQYISFAKPKGLRKMAADPNRPLLLIDDTDHKDAFRRRLVRELGGTDATIIAAAREVPSDITQYEILDDSSDWYRPFSAELLENPDAS